MQADFPSGGYASDKIHAQHRERSAMVYVRQSTMQQVEHHQESTRLQYALAERAVQFGWPREAVVVIDDDQGCSGDSIEGRPGFQRLVAEVGLGHVGLVLGIEVSRLARSCRDWHQLLEICAMFDTLIGDADGVYDAGLFNDRLLLGLKGTMSEAELHILKARMLDGRRAKAQRGELGKAVPMGYVRRPSGEVTLDPDEQARATIHLVFDLFERFRTVGKVISYIVGHDIRMPVRAQGGPRKGELEWRHTSRMALHHLFVNPIYAGVYAYGSAAAEARQPAVERPGAERRRARHGAMEVFLPDRLPAYISLEQYRRNRMQLRANRAACSGVARAGQALLSGLLVCGRCGLRMVAQYSNAGRLPRYVCNRMASDYGAPICQSLKAAPLDALVTQLVLQALEPAAIEASLQVAADLAAEREALERQWRQRLERVGYEVERAHRQYDAVEPENRLVARTLERHWEQTLAEQARVQADHARFQREQPQPLGADEIAAIQQLAQDLPATWHAATTRQDERQAIVRLMLERVLVEVVDGSEQVRVACHWHGGNRTAHQLVRPVARLDRLSTYTALVARAAELRHAGQGCAAIAAMLNAEGWRPAKRCDSFNTQMVHHLLLKAGAIQPRYRRALPLIERCPDEWTIQELARHLGMPEPTLYTWVQQGRLRCRAVQAGGRHFKLVHADAATIATLQEIRATPPPWHRRPPLISSSPAPDTAS